MGPMLLISIVVLCCPIMCSYVLSSVLWCPLGFPKKKCSFPLYRQLLLYEGACRIYVICVCLRIVVSNTYHVMFLICSLRLLYHMLPVSLYCPFFIAPCYSLTFISLTYYNPDIKRATENKYSKASSVELLNSGSGIGNLSGMWQS